MVLNHFVFRSVELTSKQRKSISRSLTPLATSPMSLTWSEELLRCWHMTPTLFRNTDVNGQVWLYSYQADLAVLVISARKGEFETGFERGGQVWGARYAAEKIKAEYSWKEDNTGLLLSLKWQSRVLLVWLTQSWSRPYLKHKLSKVSSLEREVGCYIMALLDIRLLHQRVKASLCNTL